MLFRSPANGFYQFNESGKKHAYYVQANDKELVSLAGVYNSWEDPDGTTHGTFSIITIEANDDMPELSRRMPIIIKREDEARWLDATIRDMGSLYDMLRPSPVGALTVHEVSTAVYSPKPNAPELIEAI